jgi:hypothetical protein
MSSSSLSDIDNLSDIDDLHCLFTARSHSHQLECNMSEASTVRKRSASANWDLGQSEFANERQSILEETSTTLGTEQDVQPSDSKRLCKPLSEGPPYASVPLHRNLR